MNQLWRLLVSILFLLLFVAVEREDYAPSTSNDTFPSSTSSYRQQQNPCEETMDFILTNHFAGLFQGGLSSDSPTGSKFKCLYRWLSSLTEQREREPQNTRKKMHASLYSLHNDAVDYYIYALRRILI